MTGQERFTKVVVATRLVPDKDSSVNRAPKAVSARKDKCWIRTENVSTLLGATVFTKERNTSLWIVTPTAAISVSVLAGK